MTLTYLLRWSESPAQPAPQRTCWNRHRPPAGSPTPALRLLWTWVWQNWSPTVHPEITKNTLSSKSTTEVRGHSSVIVRWERVLQRTMLWINWIISVPELYIEANILWSIKKKKNFNRKQQKNLLLCTSSATKRSYNTEQYWNRTEINSKKHWTQFEHTNSTAYDITSNKSTFTTKTT